LNGSREAVRAAGVECPSNGGRPNPIGKACVHGRKPDSHSQKPGDWAFNDMLCTPHTVARSANTFLAPTQTALFPPGARSHFTRFPCRRLSRKLGETKSSAGGVANRRLPSRFRSGRDARKDRGVSSTGEPVRIVRGAKSGVSARDPNWKRRCIPQGCTLPLC